MNRRLETGPFSAPRRQAFTALADLVDGDPTRAALDLGLPPSVVDEALRHNRGVLNSATMPAIRRYAGAVYEGLDVVTLSPDAIRLARRQVLIFSGLFGVVAGGEMIPNYRVPAKAILPGLGIAGSFWRPILTELLPGVVGRRPLIDLRSSDYASMWRIPAQLTRRAISVRIVSPTRTGYAVVSYNSKFAKGVLSRALLEGAAADEKVRDAADLVAVWRRATGHSGEVVTGASTPEVVLRTG